MEVRLGWHSWLTICVERTSWAALRRSSQGRNFRASVRPSGVSASQTLPKPPRPRSCLRRYPGTTSLPLNNEVAWHTAKSFLEPVRAKGAHTSPHGATKHRRDGFTDFRVSAKARSRFEL